MKILTVDIETQPNLGYIWGLWNQNIAISQLKESTSLMCFAAKWHDERKTMFFRGTDMIQAGHELLSEADAVVTWNGDRFDLPHFNREFLEAGMLPPAPYVSIDLLKTARRRFKQPSNKLDYWAQTLGIGHKTHHTGFQLWLDCMKNDPKAWKLMEKYNRQDVVLTEKVHDKLLPWIQPYPSVPLHDGTETGCPNCGSFSRQHRGYAYTATRKYVRYQCQGCGRWYRGANMITSTDAR